jgi:uncharacterized protein (TIGR02246 family)
MATSPMTQGTSVERGMTVERMLEFFEAWNAHDVERIVDFFTDDGAYYASIGVDDDGSVYLGREEVRQGVTTFLMTYSNGQYALGDVVIDGDRGFATWTFIGTKAGGERIRYRGVDIFTFVDDRIRVKDAFRKERAAPLGS